MLGPGYMPLVRWNEPHTLYSTLLLTPLLFTLSLVLARHFHLLRVDDQSEDLTALACCVHYPGMAFWF